MPLDSAPRGPGIEPSLPEADPFAEELKPLLIRLRNFATKPARTLPERPKPAAPIPEKAASEAVPDIAPQPDEPVMHVPEKNSIAVPAEQESSVDIADLLRLFKDLSPEHQEVLNLAESDEHSYEESAAALGIPLNTFKSRLNRARANFANILLEAGYLNADHRLVKRFLDAA